MGFKSRFLEGQEIERIPVDRLESVTDLARWGGALSSCSLRSVRLFKMFGGPWEKALLSSNVGSSIDILAKFNKWRLFSPHFGQPLPLTCLEWPCFWNLRIKKPTVCLRTPRRLTIILWLSPVFHIPIVRYPKPPLFHRITRRLESHIVVTRSSQTKVSLIITIDILYLNYFGYRVVDMTTAFPTFMCIEEGQRFFLCARATTDFIYGANVNE